MKLFMLMLGCRPAGRHTEQHDIFFGIGETVKDLIPEVINFWPEAKGRIHIDAWREVTAVSSYAISVEARAAESADEQPKLFFINLGGYIRGLFDEPHMKLLTVQHKEGDAIKWAKTTDFYRDVQFEGARSHIDDKFGVDIDDVYEIEDILPSAQKTLYRLKILPVLTNKTDEMHLGYFKFTTLP